MCKTLEPFAGKDAFRLEVKPPMETLEAYIRNAFWWEHRRHPITVEIVDAERAGCIWNYRTVEAITCDMHRWSYADLEVRLLETMEARGSIPKIIEGVRESLISAGVSPYSDLARQRLAKSVKGSLIVALGRAMVGDDRFTHLGAIWTTGNIPLGIGGDSNFYVLCATP